MADAQPARGGPLAILEYVSSSGCSDCRAFEQLLERVLPDFPLVEVRAVGADSPRGMDLSIGRGILRFPVIVVDDDVIAVESISEADLRAVLGRQQPDAVR